MLSKTMPYPDLNKDAALPFGALSRFAYYAGMSKLALS